MLAKLKNTAAISLLLVVQSLSVSAAMLHIPATAETMHRGVLSPDLPPVAHIKSGDTVTIDTVSHGGLVDGDPVKFFAKDGIPKNQVLPDATIAANLPHPKGFGGHVLTGPIYIDGAEPGDMLEIRIKAIAPRVPYGVNNPGNGGAAPGMLPTRGSKTIKYDIARKIANFAPGIEYPIHPFMGIMAVAPLKAISSRAPGIYGGNIDFNRLNAGATLYLPVLVKGALFVTGDSHANQGDGEVDGNALEASMAPTLQFIIHKGEGKAMDAPFAEDAENYYPMGMDPDLNKALDHAIRETVQFLGKHYGMSTSDAYSLCSTAVDFGIAQAVDQNLIVYAKVPKSWFKSKTRYWHS